MSLSRGLLLLGSTTFALVLAAGCASSTPSESTVLGTSSEALTKCPAGTHADKCQTCGTADGCKKPITSCACVQDESAPAAAPPAACLSNPKCVSPPQSSPGFDPVIVSPADPNVTDTTFPGLLREAGCYGEHYYQPEPCDRATWETAICPVSFKGSPASLKAGTSGVLPCDTCTGTPGAGEVVIAWLVREAQPFGIMDTTPVDPTCPEPGTGCDALACLIGDQPKPPPPPIVFPPFL